MIEFTYVFTFVSLFFLKCFENQICKWKYCIHTVGLKNTPPSESLQPEREHKVGLSGNVGA